MNVNWPRWIHASICSKLKSLVTTIPIYAETDLQPIPQDPSRVEFNWIGPTIDECSGTSTFIHINLVVLVTTLADNQRAYKAYEDTGIGLLAVPACIPVCKYGDQIGDDRSQLGILVRQGPVTDFMVGHQEPTNRIRQVGLKANYRMDL